MVAVAHARARHAHERERGVHALLGHPAAAAVAPVPAHALEDLAQVVVLCGLVLVLPLLRRRPEGFAAGQALELRVEQAVVLEGLDLCVAADVAAEHHEARDGRLQVPRRRRAEAVVPGLCPPPAGALDGLVHLLAPLRRDVEVDDLVAHLLRAQDVLDAPLLGLGEHARVGRGRVEHGGLRRLRAQAVRDIRAGPAGREHVHRERRLGAVVLRQLGAALVGRDRPRRIVQNDAVVVLVLVLEDEVDGLELVEAHLAVALEVHLPHGHVEHGPADAHADHARGLLDLLAVQAPVALALGVQHVEDHAQVLRRRRV
mmetsp:Transcript_14480/g.43506  ORF Transcript_14480/g.43506 Transcript_14480/m.43506 type:complete len:315 (-) Transcript_14480:389-1333(-)